MPSSWIDAVPRFQGPVIADKERRNTDGGQAYSPLAAEMRLREPAEKVLLFKSALDAIGTKAQRASGSRFIDETMFSRRLGYVTRVIGELPLSARLEAALLIDLHNRSHLPALPIGSQPIEPDALLRNVRHERLQAKLSHELKLVIEQYANTEAREHMHALIFSISDYATRFSPRVAQSILRAIVPHVMTKVELDTRSACFLALHEATTTLAPELRVELNRNLQKLFDDISAGLQKQVRPDTRGRRYLPGAVRSYHDLLVALVFQPHDLPDVINAFPVAADVHPDESESVGSETKPLDPTHLFLKCSRLLGYIPGESRKPLLHLIRKHAEALGIQFTSDEGKAMKSELPKSLAATLRDEKKRDTSIADVSC